MFCHPRPGCSRHQGTGRGYIEGTCTIPPGPAGIDQMGPRNTDPCCQITHNARGSGNLVNRRFTQADKRNVMRMAPDVAAIVIQVRGNLARCKSRIGRVVL